MSSSGTSRLCEARAVAIDLLQKMETSDLPIERHLLQASRLARLLRDSEAQTWLEMETSGYKSGLDLKALGTCLRYAQTAGRVTSDRKYFLTSLPRLEAECAANKQCFEKALPQTAGTAAQDFVAARATSELRMRQSAYIGAMQGVYLNNVQFLSSLRAAIHAYAADALIALEFGDVAESIFDGLRRDVDAFVRTHCPHAAEKLVAIAERMAEGTPEASAEALTSCRRLMVAVADAVFPASDEDWIDHAGKRRKVGTDNYRNRLMAFAERRLGSDSTGEILTAELEHLSSRLDAAADKACKGVHAVVSTEEARLAIVEAYILVGEIARLHKPAG